LSQSANNSDFLAFWEFLDSLDSLDTKLWLFVYLKPLFETNESFKSENYEIIDTPEIFDFERSVSADFFVLKFLLSLSV